MLLCNADSPRAPAHFYIGTTMVNSTSKVLFYESDQWIRRENTTSNVAGVWFYQMKYKQNRKLSFVLVISSVQFV